uniref:oxysterol-binding protein-related protein 11 isoform X1 n=2 Tax=Myxine glutinosa TaxID=7769 RepID=UPI0035902350
MSAPGASLGSADTTGETTRQSSYYPGKGSEWDQLTGYLQKYTNLVTGWQFRYFVLNWGNGELEYFVTEPQGRGQKPRGVIQLTGAMISPSEDDSYAFSVMAVNGEQFRLRAKDAKERQHWVSRLQGCAQHYTDAIGLLNPPPVTHDTSLVPSPMRRRRRLPVEGHGSIPDTKPQTLPCSIPGLVSNSHFEQLETLRQVTRMLIHVGKRQRDLARALSELPSSRSPVICLDSDLLILKASAAATLACLHDCLGALRTGSAWNSSPLTTRFPVMPAREHPLPTGEHGNEQALAETPPLRPTHLNTSPYPMEILEPPPTPLQDDLENDDLEVVAGEEEVSDTEEDVQQELGGLDEQRSVILHVLSHLKLGMDLTRVVLPTFILECRSLLEMFADFLSHPDLFLAIADAPTAEARMIRFVEYYLTSFREGRKGAVAKKPYNPIIGEAFRCSWFTPSKSAGNATPTESTQTARDLNLGADEKIPDQPVNIGSAESGSEDAGKATSQCCMWYIAEQVSHHPPISAFYVECPDKGMCLNMHVWTKSKFLGMSIGVAMVGEGRLWLKEHGEEYTFSLPSAYARSILTVPWLELGGKVSISCVSSGYSASITFHTKPIYGGKLHRVNAEVKHVASTTVVCRAQGEWNGTLEFAYNNNTTKTIDASTLPVTRKRVRPLCNQRPFESRRLWQNVTNALRADDVEKATEQKHKLEQRQRLEERQRLETNTTYVPKYFVKEGDGWVYHKPLWRPT